MLRRIMLLAFAAFCTVLLVIIGLIYWSHADAFRSGTFAKEEWEAFERCRTNVDEECTDQL